jgi:hypothetical protein
LWQPVSWGSQAGPSRFLFFFPNPRKTSIQLLLEAQQHKKYAQTTPLDDGVSSLFNFKLFKKNGNIYFKHFYNNVIAKVDFVLLKVQVTEEQINIISWKKILSLERNYCESV